MKHFLRIGLWTLLAAAPFAGHRMWAQETVEPLRRSSGQVMIGPDDSLTIVAINCKEVSGTWRVGTSGDLSLPMAGDFHAAGKTVNEMEAEITQRLQKYIREPHVTIHLTELRSQPVTISGYVEKPGVYQIEGQKTLFEALILAGGPKKETQTVTVRRNSERAPFDLLDVKEYADAGYTSVDLDLEQVMTGRGQQATLEILPRDIILVAPPPVPRYVHITGEVVRPGAIALVTQDTVSLSQAVATAGGATALAKKNKVYIWHINETGVRSAQFIAIDLDLIQKGKASDLLLTPGDIVVIERSTAKALLQMATTAAFNQGVSASIFILTTL